MKRRLKRLLACVLTIALLSGNLTILPMASVSAASAPEPFSVSISTTDLSTVGQSGSNYYFTPNTKGDNWAVHSDTNANNLMTGTSTSNVTRIFVKSGAPYKATLYRKNADFVFAFTAPAEGTYDLSCVVEYNAKGGLADIYINDVKVGTLDSYANSGVNVQQLSEVTLKAGELANKLTIRAIGSNVTNYYYFLWHSFDFAPHGNLEPTPMPTLEPTPEPTMAPTAEPTLAPTLAPTALPTEDPNAVKAPFAVSIDTTELNSLYVDGSNYYFTRASKGANWAIHSDTDDSALVNNANTSNSTRIFLDSGRPSKATMYRKNANLVFAFTAPASGYYDLSCDVLWNEKGGYVDIYVNDVYAGTLDSRAGNADSVQKLMGVYLKAGELANKLTIRTVGASTGTSHYFLWKKFDFTVNDTVAILNGIKFNVDSTENVFVGDEKKIDANGSLTNGGLYRFSSVNAEVIYTSSNEAVASISNNGMMKALSVGTTTLTASVPSLGYTDSIEVTVKDIAYESAEFNLADGQIFTIGDTFLLEAKAKLNNGLYADEEKVTITYESSNEDVVKIEDGMLYALASGDATVTLHITYDGQQYDIVRNVVVKEYVPPVAFELKIKGFKNAFETGSNVYFSANTTGANWRISSKTEAPLATDEDNVGNCRVFQHEFTYLSFNKKNKALVFEVDVTNAGKYDVTANMMKNEKGGYAAVYVNDVYVGTVDTYNRVTDESSISAQPLLGVELLEGVNTVAIKPLGTSGGTSNYTMFTGFSFTTPEEIATITAIDASADVDNMYIGRKEQISVDAILSNGGYYDFAQSTETFSYTSSNTKVATVTSKGVITGKGAGETTITVTAKDGGWTDTITCSVSDAAYEKVELNLTDGETIYVTQEKALDVVATLADGTVISPADLTVNYVSSDESVVKIENGILKALAKGTATITANATFKVAGITKTDTKNILITTIPLKGITAATAKATVQELDKDGVQLILQGIAEDDAIVEDLFVAGFTNINCKYTSLSPELLSIDENGICHYVSRGIAKVKLEATLDGVPFEGIVDVVSSSGKTGRTLYTDDMVANAQYNVKNYTWGVKGLSTLGGKAFQYLYLLDMIYDLIPSEGVPRSYENSTLLANDDIKFGCPACGVNVSELYGDWDCNLIEKPWKIWCPQCKTVFPTNDFALLYQRGLDENGEYNRELAYQRNAEAVARGEKDALINELYPEKGATWMVDDGFGWSPTSRTYGTLDIIQYAPVAKYMDAVWADADHSITTIMDTLMRYYLYTGDEAYGRAGAILTDRVADVYPLLDITKVSLNYHLAHGGAYSGKIAGSIGDEALADVFIQCYDAFYPMYDDEEVISYLSQKALEKGLSNPKTNGNLIRENIENGILREAIDALYTAKIYGNFGYHQNIAAKVAVALDTQPETNEVLIWLRSPSVATRVDVTDKVFGGTYKGRLANTGGEMATKYVNEIDRDGFGAEVSLNYNRVWLQGVKIAEVLHNYGTDILDLYADPKFVNMFDSFARLTAGDGYSLQLGDGASAGSGDLNTFFTEIVAAYNATREPVLAQLFHLYCGGTINNAKFGYFYNIKELTIDMLADIEEHGPYQFESENLTGYGLAIVRGGKAATKEIQYETRYDTWMYYGRTTGAHAHNDMLSIGIDAYGFNFMPDLAGPAFKGNSANRKEWVSPTISHNTVTVDLAVQGETYTGYPLHYDNTNNVKLIDVESPKSYDQTDIYRRTLVTIAANEDVGYTLDFFRVKGGNQHTYSFHSSSYQHFFTDDIAFAPQLDENGAYVGTYAGPDVPYGPDPNSTDANASSNPMYPTGYTWLERVNRGVDKTEDGLFTIKFEQTDFNNQVVDSGGLGIKVHAINDWKADSVDVALGHPSPMTANLDVPGYDYLLIQRKGENLDTLFTTLLEPYKVDDYILKAEPVAASLVTGTEGDNDVVKAVKVTLKNGRTDYVIYATNNDVTYRVTDGNVSFDFAGFIGVYSVDYFGENIYSYANDGTIIGDVTSVAAYTGTVVDFTKELVVDDYIIIKPEQEVQDASIFNNQYIYVENDAKCNGVYRILSAEKDGENVVLYLGNCSLIDRYYDSYDLDAGFVYTIEDGQSFRIPMSTSDGDDFKGTKRVSTSGDNGGMTDIPTITDAVFDEITSSDEEFASIEEEMRQEIKDSEVTEDVPQATATPAPESVSDDLKSDETSSTDSVASDNPVRNILLGGLGVVALAAGIFLILLGKKKNEEE